MATDSIHLTSSWVPNGVPACDGRIAQLPMMTTDGIPKAPTSEIRQRRYQKVPHCRSINGGGVSDAVVSKPLASTNIDLNQCIIPVGGTNLQDVLPDSASQTGTGGR